MNEIFCWQKNLMPRKLNCMQQCLSNYQRIYYMFCTKWHVCMRCLFPFLLEELPVGCGECTDLTSKALSTLICFLWLFLPCAWKGNWSTSIGLMIKIKYRRKHLECQKCDNAEESTVAFQRKCTDLSTKCHVRILYGFVFPLPLKIGIFVEFATGPMLQDPEILCLSFVPRLQWRRCDCLELATKKGGLHTCRRDKILLPLELAVRQRTRIQPSLTANLWRLHCFHVLMHF